MILTVIAVNHSLLSMIQAITYGHYGGHQQ
jgi:hypothetical protein